MSSSQKRRPTTDSNRNFSSVVCVFVTLLTFIVSCGGPQKQHTTPRGTLRFRGEPKDATLAVDETRIGPIRMFEEKGLLLKPGEHRVFVSAPGYFSDYRIVVIEADKTRIETIKLRPLPD